MSSNMYRNTTRLMAIQRATDVKAEAISRLAWQAARDTERLRAMRQVFDFYDDEDTDSDSDVDDELRDVTRVSFVETALVYTADDAEEMDIEVSAVIVSNDSSDVEYFDSDSDSEIGTLELDEWDEDFDFSSDDDVMMTGSDVESVEDEADDWDCIDDFPVQRSSGASKREAHSYAQALKCATRGREKGS